MTPEFVSELLGAEHALDRFSSGQAPLDDWLRSFGRHAAAMHTGRTFVWHRGDGDVVAFFTLAAHLVEAEELPRRVARSSPRRVPAVLLARLALDRSLQGQGLGGDLLHDALSRSVAASAIAAARLVVVDALDDVAATFYEHYGFLRSPGDAHRLFRTVASVARSLDE